MNSETITVFIAYSHDNNDHKRRALQLSNKLRQDGIDCDIDQYEEDPPEGWPRWMTNKIKLSDFVLIVCTKKYYEKVFSHTDGRGTKWESALIYGELYKSEGISKKFKPVLFEKDDAKWIPDILDQYTYYLLPKDYEKLYRKLTDQVEVIKPPVGKAKNLNSKKTELPIKNVKSDGIPENIDAGEYQFLVDLSENFEPVDKNEQLISNLLEVRRFPNQIYSADTDIRSLEKLWEKTGNIDLNEIPALLLKDKKIYGFKDFRDDPWDKLCDPGTCDPINTNSWLFGDDEDKRNKVYELFYLSLKNLLYKKGIKYNSYLNIYYFINNRYQKRRKIKYTSLSGRLSSVSVVKQLKKVDDNEYYMHHAFEGSFKSYIDRVFLEITPTYHYTINGEKSDKFREDKLKGIKGIERHQSIRNQLLLWEHVLNRNTFQEKNEFLKFGKLKRFQVDKGIVDQDWRSPAKSKFIDPDQINLFEE